MRRMKIGRKRGFILLYLLPEDWMPGHAICGFDASVPSVNMDFVP